MSVSQLNKLFKHYLPLFLLITFSCQILFGQTEISCIGTISDRDIPSEIMLLEDGNLLIMFTSFNNLSLSKISATGEELWTRTYPQDTEFYAITFEVLGDKIIILGGRELPLPNQYKKYPFVMLLSNDGELINELEFPEILEYGPTSRDIVIAENEAYFGLGDTVVKMSESGIVETVFENSRNVQSLHRKNNGEWFVLVHADFHLLLLSPDFELLSSTLLHEGGPLDYFSMNSAYYDSQNNLHLIGSDSFHDIYSNALIETITFDQNGNNLWHHPLFEDSTCRYLRDIKEYNDGYLLLGINFQDNSTDYTYVPTFYYLNQDGEFIWYKEIEDLVYTTQNYNLGYLSVSFIIEPNSNCIYFTGSSPCNGGSELIDFDTYLYKIEFNMDDVITRTSSVEATDIQVYPTVFEHSVTISSPALIESVIVYDLSGKLVQQTNGIRNTQFQLSIDQSGQQMYLIAIIHSNGEKILKRVIRQ